MFYVSGALILARDLARLVANLAGCGLFIFDTSSHLRSLISKTLCQDPLVFFMQYVHICPDDLNPAAQFAKPTRARAQLNLLQLVWTQRGNDTSTHTFRVIPTTVREPQCFPVAYPSTPTIDAGFGSSG